MRLYEELGPYGTTVNKKPEEDHAFQGFTASLVQLVSHIDSSVF